MLPSASETVNANVGMAESSQGHEPGVMPSPSTTAAAHVGMAAAAVPFPLPFPDDWSPPIMSPALIRFQRSWEAFIDSLLREWKTFNVVSALLLSYVYSFLLKEQPTTNLMQCYTYYVSDSECGGRSSHKDCCTAFAGMCVDEFIVWLYVYREIWDDEKHVWRFKMGSGNYYFSAIFDDFLIFMIVLSRLRKHARRTPRSGGTFGFCWLCQLYGCLGTHFYPLV
jgi:hypothetical protein